MEEKKECTYGGYKTCPYPEEKRKYSKWSIFLLMYGASATPISITLNCRKCGVVVPLSEEETKDRT